MNDQRLRQQYEETGNLLDVLQDPEVLREMIAAEDACGGAIGAARDRAAIIPREELQNDCLREYDSDVGKLGQLG